ncbi:MAG: hypothetical protein QM753_11305 [Thermomicrobiales bacterium]
MALVGDALNWGTEFARWYIGQVIGEGLTWSADQKSFAFDLDPAEIQEHSDPILLMASPGQDIFGHWILDYAPRLRLARLMDEPWTNRLRFGCLPPWAAPFLLAAGVAGASVGRLAESRFNRFQRFGMPSGVKSGFRLGRPVHREAWEALKQTLRDASHRPRRGRGAARCPPSRCQPARLGHAAADREQRAGRRPSRWPVATRRYARRR